MNIPIQNIFFLLSYAWDKLEETERIEVDSSDYSSMINLLSRVLVNGFLHIFKRGLDKSFVPICEEYPGIKGKINFKDSLNKNLFKQGRASCIYDEFTDNILHNQILKAVFKRLTRTHSLDKKLKNQVWDCYFHLSTIDDIELRLKHFSYVRIHRNNAEYDLLLKVCRLIIEFTVLNEEDGNYSFIDFTRNDKAMAYLFENFVRNFYAREQQTYKVKREDINWIAEPIGNSNLALLPKMQTDISLESATNKIIIDTKYYKQTLADYYGEKFHSNNLYQLYSYLRNIEEDNRSIINKEAKGILLYPKVDKDIDEVYIMKSHEIKIVTVDLSQDWENIHSRLLKIINH